MTTDPVQYNPLDPDDIANRSGVLWANHLLKIARTSSDIMFASVARDVGIASAIDYAWRRGLTISTNIIHLFDAEIRQLVDEVEAQQVGSKRELLAVLPSLAAHASFGDLSNNASRGNHNG